MRSRVENNGRPPGSELLFAASPAPMWVYDLETLRFLAVNDAAVEKYGYSREEFLAMTIEDIRPPEDVPLLLAHVAGVSSGPTITGGWRHRRKDGTLLSVDVSSRPLVYDGRRAELVLPIDVTERLLLEEQLRQAQKMEAIGRLAGGIAHDFNNLLTAILGYSELALLKARGDDPTRAELEEIHLAGERAAQLTRQLLTFSRKQVVHAQTLDLGAVVANLSSMLRRLIGEDVELITASEPGRLDVMADRSQIEQVLMNLSINAREAMPQGGRLSIELARVRLDESYAEHHLDVAPGQYAMLAVSDTGAGMDEETRRHLFEPFFTTKEGGTGLGLATVYGIVKQSGGSIWVYSEPGHGTTFKVYLPLAAVGEPELAVARAETAASAPTETVLVVEDEGMVRELVERSLRASGYRVLPAASGEQAEQLLLRGERVELVVTDVMLPELSGREVVERLRTIQPDLKALFMSGYTDDTILRRGYVAPGVDFLQKPFTPRSLTEKVREILDRETADVESGRGSA